MAVHCPRAAKGTLRGDQRSATGRRHKVAVACTHRDVGLTFDGLSINSIGLVFGSENIRSGWSK
jgi:hypothetical protein